MFQKAVFYDYTETEKGAWFKCHIPGWFLSPNLIAKWMNGIIKIDDGRSISAKQRRLLYALFKEIAVYTGHEVQELKEFLKIEFMVDCEKDYFSLSDIDVTTAREFTEYVLEFMFHFDVPMSQKVAVLSREVNNYLFLCIMHRKCAVCGKYADIHHHENLVGMGGDRDKHDHINSKFIALCREHHNEVHTIGFRTFEDKHKLAAISLTEENIKKLKL